MALFVFFLLQLTCHLLRIQPLSDQRIVFFIVLLGPLRQDLYLCGLLLLVTDAYHEVIKLYYSQSNIRLWHTQEHADHKGKDKKWEELIDWQRDEDEFIGLFET